MAYIGKDQQMNWIETFSAMFIATFFAQISLMIIDRYIKKHLINGADKLDEQIKKPFKMFKRG